MEEKYKKIYMALGPLDKKAFRKALEENDRITINSYVAASGLPKNIEVIPEKQGQRGRPSVLPSEHCDIIQQEKCKQFRHTKSAAGAADLAQDLKEFEHDYYLVIDSVCRDFYELHPDIVKKTPFMWVNSLLLELKKQLPVIDVKDAQRVGIAWDAFKSVIYKVGLFPTMEAFTNLTGIYKDTLNRQLTPEHVALKEKIYNDCRDNMINQVAYNPMTQVNKMFLLKSIYGLRENEPQQITGDNKNILNIDDIPTFEIEDKNKND